MVYSGTMHCICAIIACITVPGSVVILQQTWQVVTLLLTGDTRPALNVCSVQAAFFCHCALNQYTMQ